MLWEIHFLSQFEIVFGAIDGADQHKIDQRCFHEQTKPVGTRYNNTSITKTILSQQVPYPLLATPPQRRAFLLFR
jgi:hypothetical protein